MPNYGVAGGTWTGGAGGTAGAQPAPMPIEATTDIGTAADKLSAALSLADSSRDRLQSFLDRAYGGQTIVAHPEKPQAVPNGKIGELSDKIERLIVILNDIHDRAGRINSVL